MQTASRQIIAQLSKQGSTLVIHSDMPNVAHILDACDLGCMLCGQSKRHGDVVLNTAHLKYFLLLVFLRILNLGIWEWECTSLLSILQNFHYIHIVYSFS